MREETYHLSCVMEIVEDKIGLRAEDRGRGMPNYIFYRSCMDSFSELGRKYFDVNMKVKITQWVV